MDGFVAVMCLRWMPPCHGDNHMHDSPQPNTCHVDFLGVAARDLKKKLELFLVCPKKSWWTGFGMVV